MITEKFIIDTVHAEYSEFLAKHSVTPVIPLRKVVVKKMRPFGAAVSDGTIRINLSFVGTELYEHVLDTIRHEIAHMVVGFEVGHGRSWKACCRKIGCTPSARASVTDTGYIQNNYNYALIAVFNDDSELVVKHYKRKSKKYTQADSDRYNINGKKVKRFYFVDISVIEQGVIG